MEQQSACKPQPCWRPTRSNDQYNHYKNNLLSAQWTVSLLHINFNIQFNMRDFKLINILRQRKVWNVVGGNHNIRYYKLDKL